MKQEKPTTNPNQDSSVQSSKDQARPQIASAPDRLEPNPAPASLELDLAPFKHTTADRKDAMEGEILDIVKVISEFGSHVSDGLSSFFPAHPFSITMANLMKTKV